MVEYDNINFYSIRLAGESELELENFIQKFPKGGKYDADVDIILEWLDKISEKGALERYFRYEGGYGDGVSALPSHLDQGNVRLYCIRVTDEIIIFGNGDEKTVKKWQDDPKLARYATILKEIKKEFDIRIKLGKIKTHGKELSGHLKFRLSLD